jgi:hypothetical protein
MAIFFLHNSNAIPIINVFACIYPKSGPISISPNVYVDVQRRVVMLVKIFAGSFSGSFCKNELFLF